MKRASASAGPMPASRRRAVTSARSSRHVMRARLRVVAAELARALVGGKRVDEIVDVAVEQSVERVLREADAVIRDTVVLEVVRPNLLRAAATLHLLPPRRAHFGLLPLL